MDKLEDQNIMMDVNENNIFDEKIGQQDDLNNSLPNQTTSHNSTEELAMLLIQKECELICLRSELEIYREEKAEKKTVTSFTENEANIIHSDTEKTRHNNIMDKLIEKIKNMGKLNTLCSKLDKKQNGILSLPDDPHFDSDNSEVDSPNCQDNKTVETTESNKNNDRTLRPDTSNIADLMKLLTAFAPTTHQTQLHPSEEEKMELEIQKCFIREKELQIQQESLALKDFRNKLDQEKEELEKNRAKIERELRKLLENDDDEDEEQDSISSERNESDILYCNALRIAESQTLLHSQFDSDLSPIIVKANNDSNLNFKVKKEENHNESKEISPTKSVQVSVSSPGCSNDDEKSELPEVDTGIIVDQCEKKISEQHNFMSTLKKDEIVIIDEIETTENKDVDYDKNLSNTYQIAINTFNNEWREIKDANIEIEKIKNDLISKEEEVNSKIITLKMKENQLNEERREVEKRKDYFIEKQKKLQIEVNKYKNDRLLLEKKSEFINETRQLVEKERQDLQKMKSQYELDMQLAKEIRNQLDESRNQAILQQQKCLEEKWELFNNEKDELSKAWKRYDELRTILEWDKNSIQRQNEEIQNQIKSIENEKLTLEKNKLIIEENKGRFDEEVRNFKVMQHELKRETEYLEKKKTQITAEWEMLNDERIKIHEKKESIHKREIELKMKAEKLEDSANEMNEKSKETEKLKKEVEYEWEKLQRETKECTELKDKYERAMKALKKNYKLKKFEHLGNIKKKMLNLADKVNNMAIETATCNEVQMVLHKRNYLSQESIYGNINDSKLKTNDNFFQPVNLQKRILSLLDTVANMEKDVQKIRIRMKEKFKVKKKIKMMRKQIKSLKQLNFSLQEKLTELKTENNKDLGLTLRYNDSDDDILNKQMDEENYEMNLNKQKRNTLVMNKAKELVEDWEKMLLHQGNKEHIKILEEMSTLESHNCRKNDKASVNSWEPHMNQKLMDYAPQTLKNFEEMILDLKDKTYTSERELPEMTYNSHRGYADKTKQNKKHRLMMENFQKKKGDGFHILPFNQLWEDDAPTKSGHRKERSAWDIAFLAVILIGCGALSFLMPLTKLTIPSSITNSCHLPSEL